MKKRIFIICISVIIVSLLRAESPLTRQLEYALIPTIKFKDEKLSIHDKLNKWFPNHQKLLMGYYYYLTMPYYNDIRADFYLEYIIQDNKGLIKADTTAIFLDETIIFKNDERIKATGITEWDFLDIKSQLAWLNVLFRSLGTPVAELILGEEDEIEIWTIIYEDDKKERVLLPSLHSTIKRLNSFYENHLVYFKFNEVKKINSRLEFYGTFLIKDPKKEKTDFIDIRFHTDRWNEIDLIMLFIYRNI